MKPELLNTMTFQGYGIQMQGVTEKKIISRKFEINAKTKLYFYWNQWKWNHYLM